jgi:hypothetical protein
MQRLFAIKKEVGMPDDILAEISARLGIASKNKMNKAQYDSLVSEIEAWGRMIAGDPTPQELARGDAPSGWGDPNA